MKLAKSFLERETAENILASADFTQKEAYDISWRYCLEISSE